MRSIPRPDEQTTSIAGQRVGESIIMEQSPYYQPPALRKAWYRFDPKKIENNY
jgi:hypothetical protein